VRRAALAAALLTACASALKVDAAADARRADEDAVAMHAADLDGTAYAGKWVVVQDGDIAASSATPAEALRGAPSPPHAPAHRFLFRPQDRGPRDFRMAYVAEGGVVAGRRFLADLGVETVGAGSETSLRQRGGTRAALLDDGRRFTFDVAPPDGSAHRTVSAVLDPDFDGTLLLPRAVALEMGLELFEVPGTADVQVALGRPFRAHRAVVAVRLPALDASGLAEALFETAPLRK
jgi:hypothetical protein